MLLCMDDLMSTYHYETEASLESVSGVVDWAEDATLGHPELHSSSINALLVCLHEIMANVAMHARRDDGAPLVRIDLQIGLQDVSFTIEDNGQAFDPISDIPDLDDASHSLFAGRGVGLRIVRELVCRMFYSRIGDWNRLRLEIV